MKRSMTSAKGPGMSSQKIEPVKRAIKERSLFMSGTAGIWDLLLGDL